jgi:hypothetical protein
LEAPPHNLDTKVCFHSADLKLYISRLRSADADATLNLPLHKILSELLPLADNTQHFRIQSGYLFGIGGPAQPA